LLTASGQYIADGGCPVHLEGQSMLPRRERYRT
jgi:hypothetical protein